MRNPILFFITVAFILVNLVDAITAFFILPGESNPLFILTGSLLIPIILKGLFIWFAIFIYRRNIFPSNFMYYSWMMILILSTLMIGFAASGNIKGIMNPELIEDVKDIPDDVKVKYYVKAVSIMYYIPLLLSILSFWFYDKSLKYVKIDSEYYRKKQWWQL